jgi:flagellar export protein FliJ
MRGFRFALRGLEKVREARVDEARLTLARSEAARLAEKERIMGLEQEIEGTTGGVVREGVLDLKALLEEEQYLSDLRRRRSEALERMDTWIGAVESDRQRLLQARKEHKALERLRERRYLEFVREVMREEKQATDEAASTADWRARQRA